MNTKSIFIILLPIFFFYSCEKKTQEEENPSRISELEAREQQLVQEIQGKDTEFNAFVNSIAEVEKQLRQIHDSNIPAANHQADLSPQKLSDQLSEDVRVIENLIHSNQQVISNLRVGLRNVGQERDALSQESLKERETMEEEIRAREQTVAQLKEQLNETQATLKSLQNDVASLTRTNEEQMQALNTAYYVVGDFQALKDEQILDKKGGFLGIFGRVKMLRDDFNHNKFTRINIRETANFPVEGKELTLVSVHPPDSYTIDKETSGEKLNLVVSDPDKFWESSKYMVMLVK
ncbi:Cbp1 family collagen-binding glycoprotein adhesin [Catalinimonas niigatensis]|uniref:Cbp1 family collagen-binding glycoprotein adhesin n=1 Tax=Catalinimonas niigatensis TaxID=1397264 RepID=UPI0026650B53|nr:hypothetical protein [Catalinimonas niigatensis]WPP49821.1 hypothetical protein PZB72_24420 [Catalinimonas niigatensis]